MSLVKMFRNGCLFAVGAVLMASATATTAQAEEVAVVIRNDSPYTVGVAVNGSGSFKTMKPAEKKTFYTDVFIYVPFLSGSQTVQVQIKYNGTTRTGRIPINLSSGILYAPGIIFKRSPGVLGIKW